MRLLSGVRGEERGDTGRMRRAYLTMIALVALGGCGDGNGSTDEGGAGITLAEWSTRAEDLCEQNANRAERGVLRLTQEARAEHFGKREYAARVLDLSARQGAPALDQLAAVPPPRGHEQQVENFITRLRKALVAFRHSADALRRNDDQGVRDANMELLQQAVPARELARELNIEACIPSGPR